MFASATLPGKEKSEQIYGIKFNEDLKFDLENSHMLYLTVMKEVMEKHTVVIKKDKKTIKK